MINPVLPMPSVIVSFSEVLENQDNFTEIEVYYQLDNIRKILIKTLELLLSITNLDLPAIDKQFLLEKSAQLEIYIIDAVEAKTINFNARGKDYSTNILSYPSELPENIIQILPNLPLGELVICHEVVKQQAEYQQKTIEQHLSHLLVHGILHLLGFDHELGQAEQEQMEGLEIAILTKFGIANPYE